MRHGARAPPPAQRAAAARAAAAAAAPLGRPAALRCVAARAGAACRPPAAVGGRCAQARLPVTTAPRARRALVVRAVFEKFTERSIKAVMIGQQQARLFGAPEVRAERGSAGRQTAGPAAAQS